MIENKKYKQKVSIEEEESCLYKRYDCFLLGTL